MPIVNGALAESAPVRPGEGGGAAAHVFERDGRTVVCVHGEVDLGSAGTLDTALSDAARRTDGDIVVDLGHVRFMDVAGLRALAHARDALAAEGRELSVRDPQQPVYRLLSLFEADGLIDAATRTATRPV